MRSGLTPQSQLACFGDWLLPAMTPIASCLPQPHALAAPDANTSRHHHLLSDGVACHRGGRRRHQIGRRRSEPVECHARVATHDALSILNAALEGYTDGRYKYDTRR